MPKPEDDPKRGVLRLALFQAPPPHSEDEALATGLDAVDRAAAAGADLILFPEMYSLGYRLEGNWTSRALAAEGPWVAAFAQRARERGIAVAITFLEANPAGNPYNAVTVFDRQGRKVLHYRKVHTCAFDAEAALTPGDSFPTAMLDTALGPVSIGAMICFDREFPEGARELRLGGAELLLVPNACVMERHRQGQLLARTFENGLSIALANYSGRRFQGHSTVVVAPVFGSRGDSLNPVTALGGVGPQLLLVDLDIEEERRRAKTESLLAWRRPEAYQRLRE